MNKYCQGPKCHTYQTTDRKRGPKGSKYFQTRTVGRYGYGDGANFCTMVMSVGHRLVVAKHGNEPLTTSADYMSQ